MYDIKDNSRGGEREACTAGCMPKPDRPQLRGVTVSVSRGKKREGGARRGRGDMSSGMGGEGGHNMLRILS